MILIGANTGIRCPKCSQLKWEDIKVKKETIAGLYGSNVEKEELIAVIQINEEQTGSVLLLVKQESILFV